MLMKIRYYMSLDDIDLSGVVAMDEAHIGGWSGMHLKKKIEYMVENIWGCYKDGTFMFVQTEPND